MICTQHDGKVDYRTWRCYAGSCRTEPIRSAVTGNCPQCQRKVTIAVKSAREMALLPYLGK